MTYQIPNELYSCRIIKFMLQPLIENSIYHGLEKKEAEGLILIRVSREENFLYIIVQDDGVGFDSSCMNVVDSGYAIRNIQERIWLYYGGEGCGLFFESTIGKGCKVTIKIKPDVNPELPGNNEL